MLQNEHLTANWGGSKSLIYSKLRHSLKTIGLSLLSLLLPVLTSCEKQIGYEGHPELYDYYVESTHLGDPVVDIDSIGRFTQKVHEYVVMFPDAKQTTYYPLIQENIKKYSVTLTITFEEDWDGEDEYNF